MIDFFKVFIKAGFSFGFLMTLAFTLQSGFISGVKYGICSGVLFGLLIGLFITYQSRKFTQNRPLLSDEKLIKEGGANHFLNGEAVGGWIYLTNSRFYYKSHKSNVQNHEFVIPISEIAEIEKANTFAVIPNQLRVTLKNGQVEKFVVTGVKDWLKTIHEMI